ncbi:hypothetical protein JOL79_08355 [Microbispora sp. RL4-1S]|uniref:Uncharacterized protein n=1 Tax=Microbispora oryzae TaxID=2806554 RepID=A0A940WLS6_9ACTN|nr:hypothetical protein [Microbispora oryzae]MBP2703815.1 hypothetical protein [Microbispora oryzae]
MIELLGLAVSAVAAAGLVLLATVLIAFLTLAVLGLLAASIGWHSSRRRSAAVTSRSAAVTPPGPVRGGAQAHGASRQRTRTSGRPSGQPG